MHDIDEVMLLARRFNRNSTNPWDHDDYGNGEALANPNDLTTGPDVNDTDDDNDTRDDLITTFSKKASLPTLVTKAPCPPIGITTTIVFLMKTTKR